MDKWEYLTLYAYVVPKQAIWLQNGENIVKYAGLNGIEYIGNLQFHAYLNKLGDQGWELIAKENRNYVFKRPKA